MPFRPQRDYGSFGPFVFRRSQYERAVRDAVAIASSYIVEFAASNGETSRLEVEQHLETIDVAIGSQVPLLVRPDGKKAIFDQKDPRINMMAFYKATKKADEERFRGQLEG